MATNFPAVPKMTTYLFASVICALWVSYVRGHGRLVDPPARSTMWRLGFDTTPNYNDHQLFCGGYARQWKKNHGRCGECGDPWDIQRPRPNEAGGIWGQGVISKVYRQAEMISVTVHLTANHMGWFEFRLCPNNDPKQYVKQSCLNKHVLKLVDYPGTRYQLKHSQTGLFTIRLQLPEAVTCSQCVVQWHYTTGNNWGFCRDGTNKPGCGPQEVFRGCSDVAIYAHNDPTYYQFINLTRENDLEQFLHLKEVVDMTTVAPPLQVTDVPQGNDVDLFEVVDVDFQKPTDIKTSGGRFSSSLNSPARQNSRRPSITFIDESPRRQQDEVFSFQEEFDLDRINDIPSAAPKKYVSSDDFRKNKQNNNKQSQISAPTPFLSSRRFVDETRPFSLNPQTFSVTPSPLGPPLVFPPTVNDQVAVNRGGIHSVHSSQPLGEYEPVLDDILSKALTPDSGPATFIIPSQRTPSNVAGIPLSTLQLLQSFPSLANSRLLSSGMPSSHSQLPGSDIQNSDTLQRLLLLQQALGLATSSSSSSSNQESPVFLIVV